ncbi:MAG: hypothetical protein SynsKO_28110 [Synoicihabitans sp.]
MKKLLSLFVGALMLSMAPVVSSAAHHGGDHDKMAPKTVIHVVTVSWKDDASEADIAKALKSVHTLGKEFDGITRVWTKTLKAQGDRSHAFVMEFKNKKALEEYAGSQAQKNWYEHYIPVRARSTTFDITN